MNLFKIILSIFILTYTTSCNLSGQTLSKRKAPKKVTPVVIKSMIITAPTNKIGYIVVVDSLTHSLLWKKEIYHIIYDPFLELDVQAVFIDSIYLKNDFLIIRNEKGQHFELNLATKVVKDL